MKKAVNIKNRIVGSGTINPAEIKENPYNWRTHPGLQKKALLRVLEGVGWIQEVIINKTTGNMIDGHLRADIAAGRGDKEIPVKYVEISEQEEKMILATFDIITKMALTNPDALSDLIGDIEGIDDGYDQLLEQIAVMENLSEPIDYDEEWRGMPTYEQNDETPYRSIIVHFNTEEDVKDFSDKIEQDISEKVKYIYHPEQKRDNVKAKNWEDES